MCVGYGKLRGCEAKGREFLEDAGKVGGVRVAVRARMTRGFGVDAVPHDLVGTAGGDRGSDGKHLAVDKGMDEEGKNLQALWREREEGNARSARVRSAGRWVRRALGPRRELVAE